jgi:hypothetical protein
MNFIQQAFKGKNDWWRYLLAIIVIFTGWQIVGIIPITVTAKVHANDINEFYDAANNNFLGLGINANLYLFVMILMFLIGLLFIFMSVKLIHQRKVITVLTSRPAFDWKRFFFAIIVWSFLSLLFIIIDYFNHPQDFVLNFKLIPFLILVFISIVFLPFQTSFEEVLFRGYLMQGLGILVRNKWFPLVITSAAFGLLHSFNPEIDKLGYIIIWYYIGTGFLFGVTTLMDEGLELALGMHAANNIVASIFITTNWTVFQTDALFVDNSEPNLGMLMFVPLFIIYPLVLLIFTKKYQWKNWKEKLTGKIQKPDIMESVED